ncbi:RNA polymerase sigma factor SigW [Lentibacillus cibarius]|uniref:RNA polymerase sigma factor n=2 Tax=Lentibacillus TaxID=175304 RepID=A0A0U4G4D0_9BACI|nr:MULTISPECIES: RNA polymerase sigma factor SigW [Lentibacillus]ALX47498.1 RNA polymerase subunit sigma [Lentibacillus amyloliquefaciens]TRM11416.1 RNA polymerase sigma factor SigW [Lentibacillus cibarius]
MNDTVNSLVKKAQKGDQLAFSELIDFYQHRVYRICFRLIGNHHDAEDLAQTAFLRAYQNINSHDNNKKFSSWLFRIATNLTLDRLKMKKPDYYLDAEVFNADGMTMYNRIPANNQLPEDQVIGREMLDIIQKAMFGLSPEYRLAIIFKYLEELSLKEISDIMQIPIGTVKTRIHRGREILRKQLEPVLSFRGS